MKCALCHTDTKLCNSHIVPDFIFKTLQGHDKAFFGYDGKSNKWDTFHKTFCEKLLCAKCETQFSKWEGYAKQFMYGGMPVTCSSKTDLYAILEGIDYPKMKLFFMSLLWRFAVSDNPILKGINLGPHKERLRKLLLKSDPAESWRYGCLFTAVLNQGKHIPDLIIPPSLCKVSGHHCYRLVVGGFLLTYFVSSHVPDSISQKMVLQENGSLVLSRYELSDIPFLEEIIAQIARIEK